jgi:hypothetical protein
VEVVSGEQVAGIVLVASTVEHGEEIDADGAMLGRDVADHPKAAALLHSIVTGHALVDGNKRLVWVTVRLFYRLNDKSLHAPVDDAFDLVASIANGSLRDVTAIADRLRPWVVDLDIAG